MQRLRVAGALLAAIALAGTVTGCGQDDEPASDEPVVIDITFQDGKVEPNGDRVEVGVDQPIDLVVTADEAGSVHVHSDPEQEFAFEAGTETFKFSVGRPGVIEVESHDPDQIIVKREVR